MKDTQIIVTSVRFDHAMQAYPHRIEVRGAVLHFTAMGSLAIIKDGSHTIRFYRMYNDMHEYHLKSDDSGWSLLSVA